MEKCDVTRSRSRTDTSELRDVTPSTVGGAACGSGEARGEKYSGKR